LVLFVLLLPGSEYPAEPRALVARVRYPLSRASSGAASQFAIGVGLPSCPHRQTRQVQGMPLTGAPRKYTVRRDGIYFLMRDGQLEVICRIDFQTLSQFGRTIGPTEPTEIFETGRDRIERAASEKYDQTTRVEYEILTVTIKDLNDA
jgi:hypothetical protein